MKQTVTVSSVFSYYSPYSTPYWPNIGVCGAHAEGAYKREKHNFAKKMVQIIRVINALTFDHNNRLYNPTKLFGNTTEHVKVIGTLRNCPILCFCLNLDIIEEIILLSSVDNMPYPTLHFNTPPAVPGRMVGSERLLVIT